jgi:hypothetical protein
MRGRGQLHARPPQPYPPYPARQAWANMPYAGADNFTHDHLAGGTKGGMWRAKRTQPTPVDVTEWGYNQARQL